MRLDAPFDCGWRDWTHPQAGTLGWCKAYQTPCTEVMEQECAVEYADENPDFAEFVHEGTREAVE